MIAVYYLLGLFLYLFGILEIYLTKSADRKILYLIALLVFIGFVGLKIKGGTDFESYENIFYSIDVEAELSSGLLEPIWVLLIFLVRAVGGVFFIFHFIVAFINLSIKITLFRKLTPYLFPALLIYLVGLFFERDNDGIRQGLSIAFCFLSIPYVLTKNKFPFFICNIIAILIYYSSAVFLLCYFFPKIRWSDKTVFIIVCLSFIFPFTGISVSDLLMSLLFIPAVVTKLDVYSESSFYAGTMGINIGIIFRFIILVLFIYYHRSLSIKADLYYLLRNGFALAIVLSLVFNNFAILAHRLPYAFREFQIFIVPYFLTIAVGKGNRIIILTFTFIYTLLLLYRALIGENASYYIYDNLLFHLFDK